MSEYFAERPEDSAEPSLLPEEYVSREIESMWPGQILFLDASCLVADTQRRLFIRTDFSFLEIDGDAENVLDRVAVMRVFDQVGEELIEGYIVDLRNVAPGAIEIEEADTEDDEESSDGISPYRVPVLGIISYDGEVNRYTSSKRAQTIDAAGHLAVMVDQAVIEADTDDSEEGVDDDVSDLEDSDSEEARQRRS